MKVIIHRPAITLATRYKCVCGGAVRLCVDAGAVCENGCVIKFLVDPRGLA